MSEHHGRRSHTTGLLMTLVAALSLFVALPAAADDSFVIPARDNGCGVDLQVEAEHIGVRDIPIGNGDITFTNLENGETYLQRSRYTATETYEASTKSFHYTVIGNIWIGFYPGDWGPSGLVQEPGLELLLSGTAEFTVNRKGVLTAFSFEGTYTDLCAELNG